MAEEQRSEEVQRWTAKRRAALVISLLKGETTAAEAARRHGLKVAEVEEWRDRFLVAAENGLRARPKEDEALREEEPNRLKRKVGELTMDLDILREASRLRRPTAPGTSGE
jgi:transposase-like protein